MLKRLLNSNVVVMLYRLAMAYVALGLCRVAFGVCNIDKLGAFAWGEMWDLLRGSLKFDTPSVIYANALFIILSLLPGGQRSRGWWRGLTYASYIFGNFVAVGLNLSDAVYFHYTSKRVTAEELFFADNDNSLALIFKFASENVLLVLFGFALVAFLAWAYRPRLVPRSPIRQAWLRWVAEVVIFVLAALLCVVGIRGGVSRAVRPITLSNATTYTRDAGKANLILSNPFCIIRTMGNSGVPYVEYYPLDSLSRIYSPYHYADTVAQTTLEGRNVVVMVLESFSAEHSAYLSPDLYPDGKGYTPFLDSLMRSGFAFRSAYANGHKSIEALPSVVGSIPSFSTPFVLLPQALGKSRQMPAILADRGYKTMFFCGSERGSMGFDAYMSSAGVEQQWWREDFERRRGYDHFDGYWGIWDEAMMDFAGEVMSEVEEPFFACQFTLSSHHPFVVPDEWRERLPKGRTKVHPGVAYVDASIRNFFDKYSSEEWFSRTIFVFVADHVSSEKFSAEARSPLGSSRIIQFFYTPDGALQGECVEVAQQIDIMPSLLALLGIDEPYFAYGRNVFGDTSPLTFYWSTSAMRYVSTDGEWVVLFDGESVTDLYLFSDKAMSTPLDKALYADVVADFERRLRAVVQQYNLHLRRMDYTIFSGSGE